MRQTQSRELAGRLRQLYSSAPDAVVTSSVFRNLAQEASQGSLDRATLLASIPAPLTPSDRPLQLFHRILLDLPGPWSTFDLIQCHARLIKFMPESAKATSAGDSTGLIKEVEDLIKQSYQSFAQFLGHGSKPALRSTKAKDFITHSGLHSFVDSFAVPVKIQKGRSKPVVAIALPNGPLLAAVCIATTTYYTASPINPAAGPVQFQADVLQAGAGCILTTPDDYDRLQLSDDWVSEHGIEIAFVESNGDDIRLQDIKGRPLKIKQPKPNHPDDISLILFTSGTSGTKKVVPLTVHSIVAGIVFVMDSWGLSSDDVCLNMMPLYHVGGLVRNIFAPMFSGGSTVCCAAFDPSLFWDVVEDINPTWYYASPSMHSVILAEAPSRPKALKNNKIRLACNAAGGLLPSLAVQLRDTFDCIVLPSYGMTECMPISTPLLDYKLDRPGTSGLSTGPEMTVLDWSDEKVRPGAVGRVCVRGEPVFHGYLKSDGSLDKSPFNKHGWFDTGDLGYLDADGYLYITGRSKEVINRGGELISPFEVENAIMAAAGAVDSPISGRVTQALAFSLTHDVLQEVVAIALVTPQDKHRIDLKTLHEALRSSLQQVKWPVLITYMDDLPKKNNKVLRIKLGERLNIPEITDDAPYLARHWTGVCPPPDTDLKIPIASAPCEVDCGAVMGVIRSALPKDFQSHVRVHEGNTEAFLAPKATAKHVEPLDPDWAGHMRRFISLSVHNYMVPNKVHLLAEPLPRDPNGDVDEEALQEILDKLEEESMGKLGGSTEGRVLQAFASILACSATDIKPTADFFDLGGDSLRAGKLMSALRNDFNVNLPISLIFSQGTPKALSAHIDDLLKSAPSADQMESNTEGCAKTNSSTNPFLMLLQLFPLVVLYPMRRAFQWTIFILALSYTQGWVTNMSVPGRLLNLTVSIMFAQVAVRAVAPFIGIAAKWLIIGRYREGLYPMWGLYHTRWWIVQKTVSICGKGFFNMNESTKRLYLRMMGARIGKGVKVNGTSLGEWDLLDIRDGATLGKCTCRPFAAEGNTSMYLGRIVIGENVSVGVASIIAPGSYVPADTCIGLNSSSWEQQDADESYRDLTASRAPKPHWAMSIFFTMPIMLIAWFLALTPWLGGLVGMVLNQPMDNNSPLRDILNWFTQPERVGYHYLALVLRTMFSPYILFGFTIFIKTILDACFGKMGPNPVEGRGNVTTWRGALMNSLMPGSRLHDLTAMFGQHYEATSVAVRMLGGKIGKRVYWPGTGPGIGDYHLLDIGDDVVFGSRSRLITSDGNGSEKIVIRDRAMIADRVTLLPGVEVGHKTVMGSGALTRRGGRYADGGTYVGSKGGDAVCLSSGSDMSEKKEKRQSQIHRVASDATLIETREAPSKKAPNVSDHPIMARDSDSEHTIVNHDEASPFGRAFYFKLAPYRVMGPFAIFCYSTFITVFTAFFWNVPSITAIQLVDRITREFVPSYGTAKDALILYGMVTIAISILTTLHAIFALGIVIAAKWMLLGRRTPGNYDWDKSPYCQRWQLFLNIEKIRRNCYRGHGILGLLTGTEWIVLYFRALGATIGKDCCLFANGNPSLMFTEPDLITLGDRVTVDDASVVAHINTRGKFDLNRLQIDDRCVLRTGSRLLSGAMMKKDSCLLEHTLIMGGDVVEEGCTMQGWPAERYYGKRINQGTGQPDGEPSDSDGLRSDAETITG
ncbi:putative NRPS-like protein biosynthetic cluster [Verticillium nonalfalfae]|uniref:Putative NRPS-like protein biosynthetic cluster n=1 Tax=Verticillium nonalfalfae TaxID=1051616 RepID=A0A3M9YHG5_9PEZI|nr:putative NRPS-like protein biosynthetic cluster [Verticillium nonalfalfae]RNJ59625.1 putative NRPS-like protein biosynthetic cluster [Verticillium nonalfalfae]